LKANTHLVFLEPVHQRLCIFSGSSKVIHRFVVVVGSGGKFCYRGSILKDPLKALNILNPYIKKNHDFAFNYLPAEISMEVLIDSESSES
jgi:hypothetical protein